MLFFMLLQIACTPAEENASCPSAGDSIVLAEEEDTGENIDDSAEISEFVGTYVSGITIDALRPWSEACAPGDSRTPTLEETEAWAGGGFVVRQDDDGLWATFSSDEEDTVFAFGVDGYRGFSMTGTRKEVLVIFSGFTTTVDAPQGSYQYLAGFTLFQGISCPVSAGFGAKQLL